MGFALTHTCKQWIGEGVKVDGCGVGENLSPKFSRSGIISDAKETIIFSVIDANKNDN